MTSKTMRAILLGAPLYRCLASPTKHFDNIVAAFLSFPASDGAGGSSAPGISVTSNGRRGWPPNHPS